MIDKITIYRTTLEQALEALEIGRDYTFETAEQFHIEMRGYKQQRHDAMDAAVRKIDASITALRAALAKQPAQQQEPIPLFAEGETGVFTEFVKQEPVDHAVIAGALFDFLGWLTSRKQRVTWSSCDDATTAVDAVIEFAKMRGLSLDEVHVLNWQYRIQAKQAQQEPVAWMWEDGTLTSDPDRADGTWTPLYTHPPVIDKSAAIRIATVLGWEPKRSGSVEWVGLTEEEIQKAAHLYDNTAPWTLMGFARSLEVKLKEKNT